MLLLTVYKLFPLCNELSNEEHGPTYNSVFATNWLDSLLNQLLSWWNITPLIRALDFKHLNVDLTFITLSYINGH